MAATAASSASPRTPSSSSSLIETLLEQTARLQGKLETSLTTTNGLITRASKLKSRLHNTSNDSGLTSPASTSALIGSKSPDSNASLAATLPGTRTSDILSASLPAQSRGGGSGDESAKISELAAQLAQAQRQLSLRDEEVDNLRATLDSYERGLEDIMNKHHTQVTQLQQERVSEYERQHSLLQSEKQTSQILRDENLELRNKVQEMLAVMRDAADADVVGYGEGEEYLAKLESENESLRQLLKLSGQELKE